MTEVNNNINSQHVRTSILYVVDYEWIFFRKHIQNLISSLKPYLNQYSQKKLDESFDTLKSVIERLIPDLNYRDKENLVVFDTSLLGLETAIKHLFNSFLANGNLYQKLKTSSKNPDSIDNLTYFMYTEMARKRNQSGNLIEFDSFYAYPAITRIIKFVRNKKIVHNINEPTDYNVYLESFDNIFTLCSILILTLYGYTEILQTWYNTLIHQRHNSS